MSGGGLFEEMRVGDSISDNLVAFESEQVVALLRQLGEAVAEEEEGTRGGGSRVRVHQQRVLRVHGQLKRVI